MKTLFSSEPIFLTSVLGILRISLGLLLVYHGKEVFEPELMKGYQSWDAFKGSMSHILPYIGKSAELVSGILLTLGLFTRIGALLCIGTLAYVTFFIGHGKFWYEDQHPFMFVLFGVLFFFSGPGNWSLDARLFKTPPGTPIPE
jgi:putative oxidoreductase